MADGLEPRNALWRREEQLRRWNQSETNKESSESRSKDQIKVQFQDGCVFLAACASGDKDEVESLLERGADINTANIDGLTALHQACIDDNIDMVRFLIEQSADIDACDNEGWTALHATASCGLIHTARFLIEKGANVAAVNNDGELAIDIAEGDDMEQLLCDVMEERGVDAESARSEEEELMLHDALQWLNSKVLGDVPHPKTGATALHVAAAKGYEKVMKTLIEAGADIDKTDCDGWTPLHAAAHWGQEEACQILVENFCNMDTKNDAGQTALDIAESDIVPFLEDLKKKQATLKQDREDRKDPILSRGGPAPLKRRSSVTRMSVDQKQNIVIKNVEEERAQLEKMRGSLSEKDEEKKSEESSSASISGESSSDSETERQNEINNRKGPAPTSTEEQRVPSSQGEKIGIPSMITPTTPSMQHSVTENDKSPPPRAHPSPPSSLQKDEEKEDLDKAKVNDEERQLFRKEDANKENEKVSNLRDVSVGKTDETGSEDIRDQNLEMDKSRQPKIEDLEVPGFTPKPLSRLDPERSLDSLASWRVGLRKTGSSSAVPETSNKEESDRLARSASSPWLAPDRKAEDPTKRRPVSVSGVGDGSQDARNRLRDSRFNDFYTRYASLLSSSGSRPTTSGTTTITTATTTTTTSTTTVPAFQSSYVPLQRRRQMEQEEAEKRELERSSVLSTLSTGTVSSTTNSSSNSVRRSFEPPKRDEERETERKAKAKRARETRRSTQGVTKEDLERAEQTLAAATKGTDPPDIRKLLGDDKSDKENKPEDSQLSIRRRHAWDDKKEDDTKNSIRKTREPGISSDTTSYLRSLRTSGSSTTPSITSSLTDTTTTTATTTTPAYKSSYRSKYLRGEESDKTQEKEKDSKKEDKEEKEDPSQKSAAIRTRRKRENRRPTGKISPEDLQGISHDSEKKEEKKEEDKASSSSSKYGLSRYSDPTGSGTSSLYDKTSYSSRTDRPTSYSSYSRSLTSSLSDKETDYKRLYEDEKSENERLRQDLKKLQQECNQNKLEIEKARVKNDTSRNLEASADKRERRALERKLSELEEELKQMEKLRAENRKLREENRALTRVVSKLSK